MNRSKALFLLLVLLLTLAFSLSACGETKPPAGASATGDPTPTAPAETGEIRFTDMAGREVSLKQPAEKVVVLAASDCEILYAIGAGATLVGRGEYCDWPEEVLSVPAVQSGYETNIEEIIAQKPDIVIMPIMAQQKEQVDQLQSAGIAVAVSDAQNIEGVYDAIAMIGTATAKDDEAKALVDSMKNAFDELRAQSADSGRTIYFEVSPLRYGLWTAGNATFMDELAKMLGLTNAFKDIEGWAEISEEQVIERNPDFIVTTEMYFGDGPTPTEEIRARSGWEGLQALQNDAILEADTNAITRPGPRLVEAADALFNFVNAAEEKQAA